MHYSACFVLILVSLEMMLPTQCVSRKTKYRQSNHDFEAPPTSQAVRLLHKEGSRYSEGQVEIATREGYGVVCNSNRNQRYADVVCKQIGFSRGAKSVKSERFYGKRDKRLFLDNVQCAENAQVVGHCRWDVVMECLDGKTAHVVCQENEGCPEGWLAGSTSCYILPPATVTRREFAVNKCKAQGAYLVTIETEAENHFLSNAFWNSAEGPVLTSGLKVDESWMWESLSKSADRRHIEMTTQTFIRHFKWFPGWQPGGVLAEPTGGKKERCLFIASLFPQPDGHDVTLPYFHWIDDRCSSTQKRFQSGFQFICEKPMETTEDVGCYEGLGWDYRGNASRTRTGSQCMKWSLSPDIGPLSYPNAGLGDHNFCRNPDQDEMPWCWISPVSFEFCDIPVCETRNRDSNSQADSEDLENVCSTEEFMCSSTTCIPDHWVCDMETDCEYGDDEDQCEYNLDKFTVSRGATVRGYETEMYAGTTNETCAKHCVESKRFLCQAFSFSARTRECLLSKHNSESADFRQSRREDLYELSSQLDECVGMHNCDSGGCVPLSEVCDGKNQCGDFSDEKNCTETGDVAVQLVGGTSLTGWVEVSYHGEWGVICNDNWDDRDAKVVCRMLGYNGKAEALQRNFFGTMDKEFFMDDVECTGLEQSVAECAHSGWKNHNCYIWEVAGVKCSESVPECNPNTEFTCTEDNKCVSLHSVCDGECQCSECSDDKTCVSKISLIGGSVPSEGRVELVLNGVKGTICDDDFNDVGASVICRSLGYRRGSMVEEAGLFGEGKGIIWMDDVTCVGNETDIIMCPHNGPLHQNCGHDEDVAVVCHTSDLHVELEGGAGYKGRVVLHKDGMAGTICDDDWTDEDAGVICRMLGLSGGVALDGEFYGPGDDHLQIFLDEVQCIGTEDSIDQCPHRGWFVHDCSHSEDAGVLCDTDDSETTAAITTEIWATSSIAPIETSTYSTAKDCIERGFPYSGTVAETENGFECQRWVLNTPHRHKHHNGSAFPEGSVAGAENFCRSPDNDPQPWCYTTDPDERWGYCKIPICSENCYSVASEYTGHTSRTTSGYTCQAWSSDSPHNHRYHYDSNFPDDSVDAALNYCRSPDGDVTPWCYTSNADVRWEYCNVSKCAGVSGSFNFSGSCGSRPLEHNVARREVEEDDPLPDGSIPYSYRKMGRVYGGSIATYGMYPWQARIRRRLSGLLSFHLHHCGGTIIGEYWIVSAAHCFRDASKGQVVVRTGDLQSDTRDKYEQEFDVENIIIHDQYRVDDYDYDIALLKLQPVYGRGIVFNDYVQPACLPNETTEYQPGTKCLISGWGEHEGDSESQYLRAARVPLVDHRTCNRLYKQTITQNMACAGFLTGGTDTCAGDSGGPLVCKVEDKYTLMGVVSFGEDCATANAPGVYAKVAAFVPWIKRMLKAHG